VTGPDRPFALERALTSRVTDVTGWTTRQVAEKCGLSQHTLRWYERIGLLERVARTADGRRRYSDADVDWILLLSRLRATGMPVRDMLGYAGLVRSGAGEQERAALLEAHRERVRQALRQQQECLELLDHKIATYQGRIRAARSGTGQE
jgi:DNA-binding transcriptional MerR regulator